MPILLLTTLGSINCFEIAVKIYKPSKANPKEISLFKNDIKDQGIRIVPLPKYWQSFYKSY